MEVILKHLNLSKMEISICELILSTVGKKTDFVFLRTGQNAYSFKKQRERANSFRKKFRSGERR